MSLNTADLCDDYADRVSIAEPIFRDYGGNAAFNGSIETVKTFEDNSLVRRAVERPGNGKVLVVDGGASRRCALLGDRLAALAVQNGWAGVVIFGCIRDMKEIGGIPLGVKALATHPLKSRKDNYGTANIPVTFAGLTFVPGEHLYADLDGVLVSRTPLEA